ncbi:thyrotropin-releasing hormone-degrading ectoenzyme-like isoform X2 [Harpegnathos saltator]|uniref:thyrotropin-releasing hormone-degrading ectoenzyme-like isoform X2 n=1 Tax=Harpegnathos saltator TaxID=610380 RepID=UPI000DBED9AC|nr:thyrotropin-releasing hormone-degrading ectoenzyme-like isoform X2 [Harpegnathos saltator]
MALRNIYMKFLILLSYISICAAVMPDYFATDHDQSLDMDLQHCDFSSYNDLLVSNTRPIRYNLNILILALMNPTWNVVDCISDITIIIENSMRFISLHAYELNINTRIKVVNTNSLEGYRLTGYRYCKRSQILDLQFDKVIVPGTYNLTIGSTIRRPWDRSWNGVVKYEYKKSGTNLEKASEKDVLYDKDIDFPGYKAHIGEVISHQMARQPFTAVITQSWRADLWIGESLSKLYSHYIMNEVFIGLLSSSVQLMDLYAIQILQLTFQYETNCQMRALSEYNVEVADEIDVGLCSRWYYNKGFALLRMIEHMITRDKFQLAIKKYMREFKFRSATSYNLWITLQHTLDDRTNQMVRISEIMDTWLSQRYYPVINVFHNRQNNTVILNITGSVDMRKYTWMVPTTYTSYNALSYMISNIVIDTSEITIIKLGQNIDFAIFNREQSGYFRVNYDENSWNRIANVLHSDNYNQINVLNRAQLIDDAYYFMRQNYVSPHIFWRIASYLKHDVSYIAWYPMFNILSFMWPIWNNPTTGVKHIKEEVLQILDGLLQNLGYEEKNDEDNMYKTLRLLGTRWACKLGHRKCQIAATTQLSGHLFKSDDNKFSSWWKDWVYCAGMSLANETISEMLFEKYKNTTDIDILRYLFCSDDAQIIVKYMDVMLSFIRQNMLPYNEVIKLYGVVLKKHIRKDDVLKYIVENKNIEIWRLGTTLNTKLFGDMIMNVYLGEHFFKIVEFAANNADLFKINLYDISKLERAQKKRINKMKEVIFGNPY